MVGENFLNMEEVRAAPEDGVPLSMAVYPTGKKGNRTGTSKEW